MKQKHHQKSSQTLLMLALPYSPLCYAWSKKTANFSEKWEGCESRVSKISNLHDVFYEWSRTLYQITVKKGRFSVLGYTSAYLQLSVDCDDLLGTEIEAKEIKFQKIYQDEIQQALLTCFSRSKYVISKLPCCRLPCWCRLPVVRRWVFIIRDPT